MKTATPKASSKQQHEPIPFPACGEPVFSRADIAGLLRITTRTLDKMIGAGEYPKADFRLRNPETGDPRWLTATHYGWLKSKCRTDSQPAGG